ncbi:hypothetical protein GO495_15740 [Chitinophaga oryziterrae]|uniref:Uncharacterized protein n=1 Tax=Chitinophaga oryziterrae TaxID=1031224 RepID=A0A6N8JAQ3_9BACT|nr:hypothetical protein [Chitinophaga oryziterrae]MVT42044.1 hypothetical protein [Chitinophaga oryziterrae]
MKKIILFGALAGVVGFYACKKDDKTVTVTNTVHDTTVVNIFASGKVNADVLTAGLKVAYATPVADSVLPAASTNASAPVLDTTYNRVYNVVKSRYLTIYPPNVAGYVAGYYVQIVGAKSYFKVDYTQANGLRKAARQARLASVSKAAGDARISTKNLSGTRGTGDGYIDSTIVFKLPASINGDTFYVKYAAYDTLNRVSRSITSMVIILPEGSDALTDSLTGTWRYNAYKEYSNGQFTSDWQIDTGNVSSYQYYNCNKGMLIAADVETMYYLPYNTYSFTWQYTLGKYNMTQQRRYLYKYLDLNNSSCSNYIYLVNYDYNGLNTGGFSYDRSSKKLTLVYDDNGTASNVNLSYDTYYLSEINDSTLILSGTGESGDDNYKELYKFIKQ